MTSLLKVPRADIQERLLLAESRPPVAQCWPRHQDHSELQASGSFPENCLVGIDSLSIDSTILKFKGRKKLLEEKYLEVSGDDHRI